MDRKAIILAIIINLYFFLFHFIKMKKLLVTSCLLCLLINAWAQNIEEQLKNQSEGKYGWNKGGIISYTLSNVALENWAAEGKTPSLSTDF